MTLTIEQLESIQADALADDVDIDLEKMSLWTEEQAAAYFESGGRDEPPPPRSKPFDIIVYGATGLVGGWCLQLLADMDGDRRSTGLHDEHGRLGRHGRSLLLPSDVTPKWAIAGRSPGRLQPLAQRYGVEMLVADASDGDAAFDAIAAAATVVVAVGGPYRAAAPRLLIAACARTPGVSYLDLTGEYTFVADAIDQHNETARRCGALLVTMCGPQECCLYSFAAREAFAALRARNEGTEGKEAPALLEVT
jgi:short subunit dehydrogenase-like uncharacterized protein